MKNDDILRKIEEPQEEFFAEKFNETFPICVLKIHNLLVKNGDILRKIAEMQK